MIEGNNLKPRILYPARLSFRFDGKIKSFPDKENLTEFSTTKPALQQMLKELLWAEKQEKEKDLPAENKPQTIKKTGYISIIRFKTGKGVRQGYILSPCLFNLHVE